MRIEGWEKALDAYIERINAAEFKWGECDCLIFASDWVEVACGVDPMSKKKKSDPETIRGMYDSEESAKELIKLYRKSIRDIMDVHFERVGVNFAQRGDIVMHQMAFGIVTGRGVAMFKTEDKGMLLVKLPECKVAWRVE